MEKQRKPIKPVNDKTIALMSGLFLILLSFILLIDVGYISRTLAMPLYFLLGFPSYIIYAILIGIGLTRVFTARKTKVPLKGWAISGAIILIIGVSFIASSSAHVELKDGFSASLTNYWNIYKGKVYKDVSEPFIFSKQNTVIGGGLIGTMYISALNNIGSTFLNYVIAGAIVLIGLLLIIIPYIVRYKSLNKAKAPKQEKQANKKQKKEKSIKEKQSRKKEIDDLVDDIINQDYYVVNDRSKSIIKSAAIVDSPFKPDPNRGVKKSEVAVSDEEKQPSSIITLTPTNNLTFNSSSNNKIGGLVPASLSSPFAPKNKENITPIVENRPVQEAESVFKSSFEEEKVEQTNIEAEPERKPEQIHLDFDAQPEKVAVATDLVAAAPEFIKPVAIKKEEDKPSVSNAPGFNEPVKRVTHNFVEPSLTLLNDYENTAANDKNNETAEQRKALINGILETFHMSVDCNGYTIGPSVTRYHIDYHDTASSKQVSSIVNDIAIRLGGIAARFDAIVPGESYSGLEIPNAVITTVGFKEVIEALPPRQDHPLAVAFGKNISGKVIWADLDEMPHMLISGTTGSGKSIFLHSIIMTLIMRNSPDDLRMVLIDPKHVELSKYKGMPHLLRPNIAEPDEVVVCLEKLCDEMERRYVILENNNVSNMEQYNELREDNESLEHLPYLCVVLDEYSDLVHNNKEIQVPIIKLSQKARACGIHLIICTQRPSTDVITGVIKGNLPTHVALMTGNTTDSITIIGEGGAEKLLGKGDMLVQSPCVSKVGSVRLQGCYVQNKEILKMVDFLKSTMSTDYDPAFMDLSVPSAAIDDSMPIEGFERAGKSGKQDERYEEVKKIIMGEEATSISKIQREFGFGFTRAGRIFDQLVKDGIVEKPSDTKGHSGGCKVLIHDDVYGIEADIGSDEVTKTESLSEYIKNSDNNGGSY